MPLLGIPSFLFPKNKKQGGVIKELSARGVEYFATLIQLVNGSPVVRRSQVGGPIAASAGIDTRNALTAVAQKVVPSF